MDRTVQIMQALLALVNSAQFSCDAEGANKIAGIVQAAEAEIARLSEPTEIEEVENND